LSPALDLVTVDAVHLHAHRRAASGVRRGAAVIVHGFGGSGDEPHVAALADALQDSGLDVLTYDARGHGASGGEATLGDRERLDVAAAVDAIAVDGLPLVLVGASMGAIAALRYAADAQGRVTGVVTVACPARWRLPRNARGVLSALLTQTWLGRSFARHSMRIRIARGFSRVAPPIELVAMVGVPLAVIHGRGDPFIAPADAEMLYAAAAEPKRLALVDGMAHAFEPAVTPSIIDAIEWLLSLA